METSTQITVTDLAAFKNIIDLASSRGAFRGAELSAVGAAYEKLSAFLEEVVAQVQAQEAEAVASETADEITESDVAQGE